MFDVYGSLSHEELTYNTTKLLFKCLSISGFTLGSWRDSMTEEELSKWTGHVIEDLSSGSEIFGQTIAKTLPLSEFESAVSEAPKIASVGKIILKPHSS